MSITTMSLTALSAALQAGKISSREIVQACISRIQAVEGSIGAYITTCEEAALQTADRSDARRAAGECAGPLDGIPVAVKDNICIRDVRTTCASRMLADFVPPYSATAWERLEQAGCILLGKTNMDEFAMGSATEHSVFHPTRNPHDLTCVPGGSSGGSAAAVAAGEAPCALGSDTGGSVRQPAAFCGVVGMRPTYGTVSRHGLVAFASSLDTIGPLTRTVADNALLLDAITGHDLKDGTSIRRPGGSAQRALGMGVSGLRIGLPKEMLAQGVADDVRIAVLQSAQRLEAQGARITEVSLPSLRHALPAYYIISSAEASSNLARYDGVRYGHRAAEYADLEELYLKSRSEGFGPEVKRRILLGTYALSAGYYDAYYQKALQVRTLIKRDFEGIFNQVDALLSPAAPTAAWRLGEKRTDPMEAYLSDMHSVPASLAGIPALSVPCGRNEAGLPLGVQLMGPHFSEATLYRIGAAIEGGEG